MEDNDDDYFSDDFDSLPPGTLYRLEQDACQGTQAPTIEQTDAPPVSHEPILHAQAQQSIQDSAVLKPPPRLHTGLTNEYDTLEVGELEAEVYDNANRPPALLAGRVGAAQGGAWAANGDGEDRMDVDDYGDGSDYTQLHARLKQLEQERTKMQQDLADAKMQAQTKAGEIAIIRSKQMKMVQDYDRQLATLRESMAQRAAKHKQEVEAASSEGKMLATENIFLQHDLFEEARQLRNYKAKQRVEDKAPPVTPKKSRVLPFRDGFDDEEITAVSPSKSAARSKRATPTVPGKRKRQASQDSPPPLQPLQLSPVGELIMVDTPADAPANATKEKDTKPERKEGDQRLMKRLLNHRMFPDPDTDLEAMAKISFPSEPHRSVSSILLDELAQLNMGSYVVEYAHVICVLWRRAISENLYAPVPRFVAIARYILTMDDVLLPELATSMVVALQDCVEVNAVPRFRYSPAVREKARLLRQTPQSELHPLIDSTEALRLMYHLACQLLHVKSALENFWRGIRHSFILVMLHGSQPLPDIVLIMKLLSTSIRPDSFGPVMPTEADQANMQRYIVDRLTFMLSEAAIPDEGVEPYTPYDIWAMRHEVLLLLEAMAFTPAAANRDQASAIIAEHPNALARLFRSMHDNLDALYSSPPEQDIRVAMINGLMRLIFGVMRLHGPSINMQEKLANVPGGKQKHLVVLTRLAFCDGTVLEAGVDDETVDMAHELLEEWTNPEEAEALAEAFPSSRRDRDE